MERLDADQDGTIDYEEFIAGTINLSSLQNSDNLAAVFEEFDKDCSGYLTRDELEHALKVALCSACCASSSGRWGGSLPTVLHQLGAPPRTCMCDARKCEIVPEDEWWSGSCCLCAAVMDGARLPAWLTPVLFAYCRSMAAMST